MLPKHYSTPNMNIQHSVCTSSEPWDNMHSLLSAIFQTYLVCLEANEKLANWRREHDGSDRSHITGTSTSCSNVSQISTNKTTSLYLTVATSSVFMAASKDRCKMMKLLSRFPMRKLFEKETLEKLSTSPVYSMLNIERRQNSRPSTQ